MDKSIQSHGAVLRSTYVDCQYSAVRICAYVVPVTMLKFLLSSRICGSSCCSLLKYSLSKFELRCEQEVDAASICKRTATCPLTISHVISRPSWSTWLLRNQILHEITEKYKTSLSEYAVVTTAVNTYSLQYVILFPGPSSRTRKSKRYTGERFGKQSAGYVTLFCLCEFCCSCALVHFNIQ